MRRTFLLLLLLSGLAAGLSAADAPGFRPERRVRRPVALAVAGDGRTVYAANQRSGTVSVLDAGKGQVVAEVAVGRRLADLASLPDGRLLAADEAANEVVLLGRNGTGLAVLDRRAVSPAPVCVRVSGNGRRAFVASLWSRRVSVLDVADAPATRGRLRVVRTVTLPFPPRLLLPVAADSRLVVADAFGGRLAVVDVARGEVESVRELPGHNLRGLALSADGRRLHVAHQALNGLATTDRSDLHWGNLVSNTLRSLSLARVLDPRADLLDDSRQRPLGDVGFGAADPGPVAVSRDGRLVAALSGVHEVVAGREDDLSLRRVPVGTRPAALALTPDGRGAFVAAAFSDSVHRLDLEAPRAAAEIRLGPAPDPTPADRGEQLFYDARLSHDGWMSCHSCHPDGHSNGRLADTRGDGSFGAPKRVLSLLGVKDTGPWAWNGGLADLEGQVRQSITGTMGGQAPRDGQVRDLAAYLRTLTPPPGHAAGPPADVGRGREVFTKHGCQRCHTPPAYTSAGRYDVGLADEVGNREFNPPSLRGVAHGGPYLHDGRATTLEEVFRTHRHQVPEGLPDRELADLLAFLRSL